MSQVRNIADGDPYEPQPGEHLLQLANTGDVPLYLGIRRGEFMLAAAAGEPVRTYILTEEQYVRLQQQLAMQAAYKEWLASGLLTLVDPTVVVPPPPPPETEEELPVEEP
jgi:hypothetical protein